MAHLLLQRGSAVLGTAAHPLPSQLAPLVQHAASALRSIVRSYAVESARSSALVPRSADANNAATPTSAEQQVDVPEDKPVTPARTVLPTWLRNLFPGGRDLVPDWIATARSSSSQVEPTSAGSSTPAASSSGSSINPDPDSQDQKDLKELEDMTTMDMDGYMEYVQKMRGGMPPPRPRMPPMPRSHPDYDTWQDMRRIAYLRLVQHEKIASLMTPDEKARILAEQEEVLRDKGLMQTIAQRTGLYIDLEVKDCISEFLKARQNASKQLRYVRDHKQPFPRMRHEQKDADAFMKALDEQDAYRAKLAKRDRAGCPLLASVAWSGANATCSRTGLKFWECCGARQDAKAVPPFWMRPEKQKEDKMFKGRSESRLRKAYKKSREPKFQK